MWNINIWWSLKHSNVILYPHGFFIIVILLRQWFSDVVAAVWCNVNVFACLISAGFRALSSQLLLSINENLLHFYMRFCGSGCNNRHSHRSIFTVLKICSNLIIPQNLCPLESWEVQILILNLSDTLFELFTTPLHV